MITYFWRSCWSPFRMMADTKPFKLVFKWYLCCIINLILLLALSGHRLPKVVRKEGNKISLSMGDRQIGENCDRRGKSRFVRLHNHWHPRRGHIIKFVANLISTVENHRHDSHYSYSARWYLSSNRIHFFFLNWPWYSRSNLNINGFIPNFEPSKVSKFSQWNIKILAK